MSKEIKVCARCGTTKALTKHHINGSGKGPKITLCVICHMLEDATINEKTFRRFRKKALRRYKKHSELWELCQERINPDGTLIEVASLGKKESQK